uniref:solute carrier family 43 member 3-like n=1 Tax=Styela clava TaxID=7725 RepID=UPI00193A135C|nr:solute carrier family 43 member 3-like [Styela clava]
MDLKYFLALLTGVLECLLFSGILFGWASLNYVLQQDGYFSNLCDESNQTYPHNVSKSSNNIVPTASALSYNATALLDVEGISSYNGFNTKEPTKQIHEENLGQIITCDAQSEQLNLVFTIASSLLSFSTLINGYIYDKFGTWVSRVISITLFTIGCLLMIVSNVESSWLLFPAMTCFAIGGILMLMTNLQIGNLFGRFRSSVITMMSGALDSSSFVFLMYKMLYDEGVSLNTIFHVTAWCTIFLWVRTFILLPRNHIPFPIKKDYQFGLADCKSRKKELEIIEMKENQEVEALTELTNENQESTFAGPASFYIKKGLYWSNTMHFSLLQLRNYFFMSSLVNWLTPLTGDSNTLNSYLVAFGTCQLFGVVFAPFNGLLIDAATRILRKNAKFPDLVPLKAVSFSALATTLLGTLFSIVIVIPSLPLQYVSFILQVIFRSFLYGGSMSFIAIAFPGQHFGKLYGLTMCVGGLFGLLQFPLFAFVLRKMDGDFFIMNIMFVFISLLTLFHPIRIYMWCKQKAKKYEKSIVNKTEEETDKKS